MLTKKKKDLVACFLLGIIGQRLVAFVLDYFPHILFIRFLGYRLCKVDCFCYSPKKYQKNSWSLI